MEKYLELNNSFMVLPQLPSKERLCLYKSGKNALLYDNNTFLNAVEHDQEKIRIW